MEKWGTMTLRYKWKYIYTLYIMAITRFLLSYCKWLQTQTGKLGIHR